MRLPRTLALAFALALATMQARATPLTQDHAARMTIAVMVNGHGPYPFVIDTGADRTVISRELAATLKLPPGAPVRLHDTAGAALVDTVVLDTLAFGGRSVHALQAPVLEAANLGADGMIGIDSLHDQHVTMDFANSTFASMPSADADDAVLANTIVVHGRSRFGQLVLVDADVGGEKVFVILDSGAQNSIGNAALQHMVNAMAARRPPTNEVISVMGGHTPAHTNTVDEIRLGGMKLLNLPIAYADLETFRQFGLGARPAILLGMDALRLFRSVSVDFRRREAAFVTQ